MVDNKDKIKELFKAGLENFQLSPPPDTWNRIQQRRRKRRLFVWYRAAAASLLLLLGMGGLLYVNFSGNETIISESIQQDHADDDILTPESETDLLPSRVSDKTLPLGHTFHYLTYQKLENKYLFTTLRTEMVNRSITNLRALGVIADHIYQLDHDEVALAEQETGIDTPESETTALPPADLSQLYDPVTFDTPSANKYKGWNLALGYGTNPSFAMPDEDYVIEETRSTFAHDEFTSDMAYETAYFEQIESTEHKHPVGLGFMAGYALSKRWEIETGLVYTRLTSVNSTYKMNGFHKEYETSIYYLGAPVGLRFNVVHRDLWKLFLNQSFVIEKGLRNRFSTYYMDNDVEVNVESTYAPVRGIQLSILSGVGIDLTISKQFSLYGQGGIQYFFLNESQPYTIRSTNPLWPSIQTGIRYNFR